MKTDLTEYLREFIACFDGLETQMKCRQDMRVVKSARHKAEKLLPFIEGCLNEKEN